MSKRSAKGPIDHVNDPRAGAPNSGRRTISSACRYAPANRFMYPTMTGTPSPAASSARTPASAASLAPGFSANTGTPR